MKKLLLICLMLLMAQGVCWAKIEKGEDKFDGDYWYIVSDNYWEYYTNINVQSTFNLVFSDGDTIGSPNLIIDFTEKNTYAIDPTIRMKIDGTIYTWDSQSISTRSSGSVNLVFGLPSNVYAALMTTKNPISIRFTYRSLTGHYRQDYSIPYKTIKDVQTMYEKYYKDDAKMRSEGVTEETKQPAK